MGRKCIDRPYDSSSVHALNGVRAYRNKKTVLLIQNEIKKEEKKKKKVVRRVGQHANTWWCPAYTTVHTYATTADSACTGACMC
jgi:hypothetical protein